VQNLNTRQEGQILVQKRLARCLCSPNIMKIYNYVKYIKSQSTATSQHPLTRNRNYVRRNTNLNSRRLGCYPNSNL
jgi:hypothetical protein